jgi:hypothetical protein
MQIKNLPWDFPLFRMKVICFFIASIETPCFSR